MNEEKKEKEGTALRDTLLRNINNNVAGLLSLKATEKLKQKKIVLIFLKE